MRHPFADHAPYRGGEFEFGDGLPVLMTEKDAVKYEPWAKPEHWYVEVVAELPEADAGKLLKAVLNLYTIKRRGLRTLE